MKVFNPGEVPVPVDDGVIVPALSHAEIAGGPRALAAVEAEQLLDQTVEEPPPPGKKPGESDKKEL